MKQDEEIQQYRNKFIKNPNYTWQYKWKRRDRWRKMKQELGEHYSRLIMRMPRNLIKILTYLGKQQKKERLTILRIMIMQYYDFIIRSKIEKNNGGEQ